MVALGVDRVRPPDVAALGHRHVVPGALEHDHVFHGVATVVERFVGGCLEFDDLTAPVTTVRGNHEPGARVPDTVAQRICGEAAEHDRMGRPDPCAGLHGDDGFRHHRHVDHDAITRHDAEAFHRVAETANVRE